MRWPLRLIGVAVVAFVGTAATAGLKARTTIATADSIVGRACGPATSAAADGYAGSASCQSCHESEYASWRRSLHRQMTKPIAEATVVGDFGADAPVQFAQYGRAYTIET